MAESNYDELAARLTAPLTSLPAPQNVRTGSSAAEVGNAFVLNEFSAEELARVLRRGRPRVGASSTGESPTVRGRISDEDFVAFKRLEQQTGKRQSELVREAIQLLLAQHKAS